MTVYIVNCILLYISLQYFTFNGSTAHSGLIWYPSCNVNREQNEPILTQHIVWPQKCNCLQLICLGIAATKRWKLPVVRLVECDSFEIMEVCFYFYFHYRGFQLYCNLYRHKISSLSEYIQKIVSQALSFIIVYILSRTRTTIYHDPMKEQVTRSSMGTSCSDSYSHTSTLTNEWSFKPAHYLSDHSFSFCQYLSPP